MKKKGKEICLTINDNYNVVSGTVDNKIAKSIYINISCWGSPKLSSELINYDRVIRNLRKQVKQVVYDILDETKFYKDRIMVFLDMRSSGVLYGKRSYMDCEITLFKRSDDPVNSSDLEPILTEIGSKIINLALNNNKYFTFYKRKRSILAI